jgi:RNA polymerase sigma-70 factor (sigma-B/F/G subfamily)
VDVPQPLAAERSREQLIEAHLPLVRSIAHRYSGHGEDLDDLVQLGAVGLIKASKRFDPSRGVTFGTFAAPAIEGEIRRHLRDRAHPVRIPRRLDRMSSELRHYESELSAKLGRAPALSELAAALGVEKGDVERALDAQQARESVPISAEDALELGPAGETPAESDDRLTLEAGLRALNKRERRIVFLRFHADMTERQIASEVGLSQAHVSRLLGDALEKLRKELAVPSTEAPNGDINGVISPAEARSGPRIPGVGDAELDSSVERYLELPYHIDVRAEQDGERSSWKATVEELPGCTSRGETPDEAVARLRPEMESWLAAAIAEDREIPVPAQESGTSRAARGYSGRFLVRMPKPLHEQLALAAEREHVSLNRFVTDALAASIGHSQPANLAAEEDSPPADSTPASVTAQAPARALRVALATNLVVVVVAGLVAVVLLALALSRGI